MNSLDCKWHAKQIKSASSRLEMALQLSFLRTTPTLRVRPLGSKRYTIGVSQILKKLETLDVKKSINVT